MSSYLPAICCASLLGTHIGLVEASSLSSTGPSGRMQNPDGFVIPEGVAVFSLNNGQGREFAGFASGRNYQFGLGLLPYLEVSGRLADYPVNGRDDVGVRDLSANVKLAIPRLFKHQPAIAVGVNDLAGGVAHFKSKYLAVSEVFGPLHVTLGAAKGKPYLGRYFGTAELDLWASGASILVERNSNANYAGFRYASGPLGVLGGARIVAAAQRSFGVRLASGREYDRTAVSLNLVVPLERNYEAGTARRGHSEGISSNAAEAGPRPMGSRLRGNDGAADEAGGGATLEKVRGALIQAGLERVRVGARGAELVIEYENHRYNRNELDAAGIALGAGALMAPAGFSELSVIAKKTGLDVLRVTVPIDEYRRFQLDEEDAVVPDIRVGHGRYGVGDVAWSGPAGPRGYSRIRIDPQLVKFAGTELGAFDYSLAANIQLLVPLWKGAEFTTSYVVRVHETDEVAEGWFAWARQREGLKAAVVSQAFWMSDRVLNVTSAGKLLYDHLGIQNETTWLIPGSEDQVRVQYTRAEKNERGYKRMTQAGSAVYSWNYVPLQASVDLGYARYRGGDAGPVVQLNRWFGDVQAQLYVRKVDAETRVGFGLAFPLTPRQGMKPGLTHVEGSSFYPLRLETKWARPGECNCITSGVFEDIPMVYSSRTNLLNNGRVGRRYLISQLPRMRQAANDYLAGQKEQKPAE